MGVLKSWIAAWCLCVAVAPAAAQHVDGILVNADIIAMSEAGLRSDLIVSMIKTPYTAFDVEVDDLVRLGAAGDDDVIAAMMAAEYTVDASPPVEPETDVGGRTNTPRAPAADRDRPFPMATTSNASVRGLAMVSFLGTVCCGASRRYHSWVRRGHRLGATLR